MEAKWFSKILVLVFLELAPERGVVVIWITTMLGAVEVSSQYPTRWE
jgi:hypothetical protein